MMRSKRKMERRILDNFVAWVEQEDGEGIFTTVLRGKKEVYLSRAPLPPMWQEPFPTEGVISEW
jgi:hypothetical protein